MSADIIRVGTRRSKLALAQTGLVIAALKRVNPTVKVEVHEISTTGDKLYEANLALIGGKGLFLKEIEEQLLNGNIDIAVHSMKDVPVYLPDGLVIDCMLEREDVRDAFISFKYKSIAELPEGAVIGTSSLRRKLQLLAIRSDLRVVNFRGNVQTRLDKLDKGGCDAIILAYAGLKRLALEHVATDIISTVQMLPAVGQGAIGIERRENDTRIRDMLAEINHWKTVACVSCERSFMRHLTANCVTPLAALATINTSSQLKFDKERGTQCSNSYISNERRSQIDDGNWYNTSARGIEVYMKVGYSADENNAMKFADGSDIIENTEELGLKLSRQFISF